jgi:hypothetical protein
MGVPQALPATAGGPAAATPLSLAALSLAPERQQQAAAGAPQPLVPAAQQAPAGAAAVRCPGHIFVSVPAYRDSEAQWTLADLFAKATHPERVRWVFSWCS